MNKTIGIAAALVIAALLALYLLGGSSDESESSVESSDSAGDTTAAKNRVGQGIPRPLRMAGESLEPSEPSVRPGDHRTHVREDGTVVRDHRTSAVSEEVERRVTVPKALSPVQPETLAAVRTALRPGMQRCIKTHAAEAPEGASAQAVLTVSIVDEALTVDTLALSTEGLEDDEDLKACIRDVMQGHQQTVAGANDVAAHSMTFPYAL